LFYLLPCPPRSTLFPYTTLFRSVHADPRPGGRAAAHRIDQHVGRVKEFCDLGVTRLPAFEPRERVLLALGSRDLDQRELGGAGPDRKSTRLNSSYGSISYAVFCL